MVLNNINNLIILTEHAAGSALLDGVKHGVKQFGRGLTDIFHLGKFNALKDARDNFKKETERDRVDRLKIDKMVEKSNRSRGIAMGLEKRLQDASDSADTSILRNSVNRANRIAKQREDAAGSADADLNKQYEDFIARHYKRVIPLQKQLDIPRSTDKNGKLARKAGRATAGIAATGGTVAGINAATNKLAASNNKEESK